MNVIHQAPDLADLTRPVCAAIGVFDGVHLGHQQVIRRMLEDAQKARGQSVVITFDRHPSVVLAPERAPQAIYPLPKKLAILAALNIDTALVFHFDRAFSEQTGETFIHSLASDFGHFYSLSVGTNFTFGYQRRGNLVLLEKLGGELGFMVHGVAPVTWQHKTISSTRVREAIRSGNFDEACPMLGRPYTLVGQVVRGDHIGRQLGFPTANLATENLVLPREGVYAIKARVNHQICQGVLNIGWRPTLDQPQPQLQVEAHLFDFSGDLYDAHMELELVAHLRAEQKFPSVAALKAQITQDISAARNLFEK